ncbi:MAG: hypothetical protein V7K64_04230 [Nostoc sp.]
MQFGGQFQAQEQATQTLILAGTIMQLYTAQLSPTRQMVLAGDHTNKIPAPGPKQARKVPWLDSR